MKILLIEDNPGDARLIQEILKETGNDFKINAAETLKSGLQFLLSQDVNAILLDMNLPDSRGLETLTTLQRQFSHIPIVIMSSIDDKELAVQAVRLGAQDYLVKGQVDSDLLRRTLIYAVERKQAEEIVLHAKEEWELTFNSVPDLIAILDCQHRVIRANKAMADRLGLTPEKCVGAHCYEVVHGLPYPPEFCPHTRTCQDGKEHVTDVHEPRLGGDFIVSTSPIKDKHGVTTGSVHVARDITDRKRAEELAQKRSAELEVANKELEAFSYSVSHDLRAPLRSMDGFSQAILEDYADKMDAQCKEYLEHIRSSSQLMSRLIDDILTLSGVTRAEMNLLEVNLGDLAEDVSNELKRMQPERRVEFKITPGLKVNGDNNLLKTVLDNLLGNAFKFTGKNPQSVIEFGAIKKSGEQVFFVRDNGAGFDMKYADKLFKPFQRLHSAREFPGTGIGLASVQRIIRRHGGRIWAEGKVGEGATFYFTLDQISD